jgi:hypothetical protein
VVVRWTGAEVLYRPDVVIARIVRASKVPRPCTASRRSWLGRPSTEEMARGLRAVEPVRIMPSRPTACRRRDSASRTGSIPSRPHGSAPACNLGNSQAAVSG